MKSLKVASPPTTKAVTKSWTSNRPLYNLLTDAEVIDLIDTYGRLNQAPERVYNHAVAEYKYAVRNGLLDNRKYFSQATRLK